MSAQLDLAARSQNPVPGQTTRRAQRPRHQSRSAWISGGFGDRSVGGNVSTGHLLNGGNDTIAHLDFPSGATCYFAQLVIATCDALTVEAHSPRRSISVEKVCIRGPKGVGVRFYKFLQERSYEKQAI